MKPSYYALVFTVTFLYLGWYISLSYIPDHSSIVLSVFFAFISIIHAFLPGVLSGLIVFNAFQKRENEVKINISLLLLCSLLFAFANLNIFGMQHPENLFFSLFIGFLGIKLVERNIEKFHAKEI